MTALVFRDCNNDTMTRRATDVWDLAHFRIRLRGGKWTKKFKGVAADACMVAARATARPWCQLYAYPLSKSYYYTTYGHQAAHMLVEEWCRRASFFHDIYMDAVGDDATKRFVYDDLQLLSYLEDADFQAWVETVDEPKVRDQVERIRNLHPRKHPKKH